jgi:hypothetical protein
MAWAILVAAAGAAAAGLAFLGDAVSAAKLVSIGLILTGVVGLNLSGATRDRLRCPAAQRRDERSRRAHGTVSAMPRTIHGTATIRSLQVICVVRCCQWRSGISAPGGRAWPVKVQWS